LKFINAKAKIKFKKSKDFKLTTNRWAKSSKTIARKKRRRRA